MAKRRNTARVTPFPERRARDPYDGMRAIAGILDDVKRERDRADELAAGLELVLAKYETADRLLRGGGTSTDAVIAHHSGLSRETVRLMRAAIEISAAAAAAEGHDAAVTREGEDAVASPAPT